MDGATAVIFERRASGKRREAIALRNNAEISRLACACRMKQPLSKRIEGRRVSSVQHMLNLADTYTLSAMPTRAAADRNATDKQIAVLE